MKVALAYAAAGGGGAVLLLAVLGLVAVAARLSQARRADGDPALEDRLLGMGGQR